MDDYTFLWTGIDEWHVHKMVADGRPLQALAKKVIFSGSDVGSLRWVRLIGIIGVSLLAYNIFLMLTRGAASGFHAFCVSVVIGCSFPFQVVAAWATMAPLVFSAAISGLAFRLGDHAFYSRRPRTKWLSAAGSCLALLTACMLYQPMTTFFWVFAFIGLLGSETPLRETIRRFAWCCMIGLAGMSLGFVTYKLGAASYPEMHARGGLVRDAAARVEWFLRDAFPGVLNAVALSPTRWLLGEESVVARQADERLFAGVFVIVIGGLALYFRGALREKFWRFLIAACLLILSHAPGLAVEAETEQHRVFMAITSMIVVCMYFSLLGYGRFLSRLSPLHANVVAGGAAFFCALSAAHHVRDYFVAPQARELEFMRSQLARKDFSRAKAIHVIPSDAGASPFGSIGRWEFSQASSSVDWTPPAMVGLLLRSLSAERVRLPVVVAASGVSAGADSLIVDMRGFRESGEWLRSDDPHVFGMPMIRSGFDVYLDDGTLYFVKNLCLPADTERAFFLRVTPVEADDLPARSRTSGFDDLGFDFAARGAGIGDKCIAAVELPPYRIARIDTGQSGPGRGGIWRQEIFMGSFVEPGTFAAPVVRSNFDVYLDGRALHYVREPCAAIDTEASFFLNVVPEHVEDLPKRSQVHGFENRGFYFDAHGAMAGARCVATVELPWYPVDRIRTGQSTQNSDLAWVPSWSGEFMLDVNEYHEPLIADMRKGGWKGPADGRRVFERREIRPGFDVYLDEDSLLHYVKEPCLPAEDGETPIFLHVTPVDPNDLPKRRRAHGFEDLDFSFDARGVGVTVGARCIATVRLPRYAISSVETGQITSHSSRTWRGAFHLSDERERVADSGSGAR